LSICWIAAISIGGDSDTIEVIVGILPGRGLSGIIARVSDTVMKFLIIAIAFLTSSSEKVG
jgi:ADP-ribosylglycohydrolase